jgi:hypothetical protein
MNADGEMVPREGAEVAPGRSQAARPLLGSCWWLHPSGPPFLICKQNNGSSLLTVARI